nr:hypothetical protein [Neisseria meningitidis]
MPSEDCFRRHFYSGLTKIRTSGRSRSNKNRDKAAKPQTVQIHEPDSLWCFST